MNFPRLFPPYISPFPPYLNFSISFPQTKSQLTGEMDTGANRLIFRGGEMDWGDWEKVGGLDMGKNGFREFISKMGGKWM